MHRTATPHHQRPEHDQNEWDLIPQHEWKFYHRWAARSNGWVTPANIVTLGGAAITLYGLASYVRGDRKRGILAVGAGRLLDLADGALATKLRTRGPKGAALDAGVDKALSVASLAALTYTRTLPRAFVLENLATQGKIAQLNLEIAAAGGEPNPSENGKRNMASLWFAAGAAMVADTFRIGQHDSASLLSKRIFEAAATANTYLSVATVQDYSTQLASLTNTPEE